MKNKKCYFYNVGVTFDRNNKEELENTWNCCPCSCYADICNGLWCEGYGIEFNKDNAINLIKEYVKCGVNNTYGYIKEVNINLAEEDWKEIYDTLIKDYKYKTLKNAEKNGYIPYDFVDIMEDYSSNWEKPDMSFIKKDNNILENKLEILNEKQLNKETIKWINKKLYGRDVNCEIGEENTIC